MPRAPNVVLRTGHRDARRRSWCWSRRAQHSATGRSTGALSGNTLSWAYVFEWPFFAGYGTYVWWKLVHDQMEPPAPLVVPGSGGAAAPVERIEEPDEELAAYNRYLAQLNASGRTKRW